MNIQPVLQIRRIGDSFELGSQIHVGHFDNGRVEPVGENGVDLFTDVFPKIPEFVGLIHLVVNQEKLLQSHSVAVVMIPEILLYLFLAQQADFLKCLLDVRFLKDSVGKSLVPDLFVQPDNHQPLFPLRKEQFVGIVYFQLVEKVQ